MLAWKHEGDPGILKRRQANADCNNHHDAAQYKKMIMANRVAKNVWVNFLGRGWEALLSIALTPIYIKFLGIEAYGLIGVFITLQSLIAILDMGLGTAANREMAALSVQENSMPKMRNLVRTLEWIYWGMAICIGIFVAILAYPISHNWIKPQELQPQQIETGIVLIGLMLAAQWPASLYGGALMGLQRQTALNVIGGLSATIRAAGAVLILWKVSSSIIIFFAWQAFAIIIQTMITAWYLWKQLGQIDHKPAFKRDLLRETRQFAAEMSGIAVMAAAFMQLDKIVLSKVLTLEHFGYYSAATVAARSLYIVISPIFSAIFPKFSQLVQQKDKRKIRVLYDQSSQLMAITILPLTMILVFFSYDLLLLWTHNESTANNGAGILALLAIGNALNGLMNVPYALQLAAGDTKTVLKLNAGLMIATIPAIILLANQWGGVGAASAWVGYTLAFWIIDTFIVHKKYEYLDNRSWMWNGTIKPSAIAFAAVFVGYIAHQAANDANKWMSFAIIGLTALGALFATAITSPQVIRYMKDGK